ncbi:MAG: hypothetical protein D6767_04860 [Candidatus Hydrogenedentota bacterium]|nr:MAG: hypothetical protein D6767_04860 [Candidatus Hydrogenedentota bacterium]
MQKRNAQLLFISFVLLVVIILITLAYFGFFSSISIKKASIGPYKGFLLQENKPFKTAGQALRKGRFLLRERGITTKAFLVIYYGDPYQNNQSYEILFIPQKEEDFKKTPPTPLKKIQFPLTQVYLAEFPFRSEMAIPIAQWRLSKKLSKYSHKKIYRIEFYTKSYMYFAVPVENEVSKTQ